jgi:hemolysin activation/secretion protein
MRSGYRICRWLLCFYLLLGGAKNTAAEETLFDISAYEIVGSSIFPPEKLVELLKEHAGPGKSAEDVESARSKIEKYYHDRGYPTVLVNIPEQSVEGGVVRLEVIESKIRRVRITGNRYFTMEKILKKMPGIQPGKILYVPEIQEQLSVLNRHPDLKVAPVLMPGKQLGTIDIELKVKDKLPLHGELELNNRDTHSTTDLRLNGLLRYDNLWQKEHSLTLQGQTSPRDTEEVQSLSGSYTLPPPWDEEQVMALYAIWSDSETAFGEGFQVNGRGKIFGVRDVIPLPAYERWYHNLSLGVDYKDFEEKLAYAEGSEPVETPVTYMPAIIAYTASLQDDGGVTHLTSSVNFLLREMAAERAEFEDKRFKARANYVYATLGISREQELPYKALLKVSVDGQYADQPLIANEQYTAGGVESVHGYKENEISGDNALRGVAELVSPDLAEPLSLWAESKLNLRAFYEYVAVQSNDPLPQQDANEDIQGVGAGLDGGFGAHLNFGLHWGMALTDTRQTDSGAHRLYFRVKLLF